MTWTIIAVLILVGFLFLLLEILVLPGTNIAGVLGFILVAIGVWQSFAYGNLAGGITLAATVVLSIIALYYSLKSKTWQRAALNKEIKSKVNVIDLEKIKVGDKGKSISRLAPMGKARINGEYYEVRTDGEFIDENVTVEITKIDHNKITVSKK